MKHRLLCDVMSQTVRWIVNLHSHNPKFGNDILGTCGPDNGIHFCACLSQERSSPDTLVLLLLYLEWRGYLIPKCRYKRFRILTAFQAMSLDNTANDSNGVSSPESDQAACWETAVRF
jgi:hypothetical protein